jgi:hypothetical protein
VYPILSYHYMFFIAASCDFSIGINWNQKSTTTTTHMLMFLVLIRRNRLFSVKWNKNQTILLLLSWLSTLLRIDFNFCETTKNAEKLIHRELIFFSFSQRTLKVYIFPFKPSQKLLNYKIFEKTLFLRPEQSN